MGRAILGAVLGFGIPMLIGGFFLLHTEVVPDHRFHDFLKSYLPLIRASLSILGTVLGSTGAILAALKEPQRFQSPTDKPDE